MNQENTSFKDHEHDWHTLKPEEVLRHFEVQDNGLTTEEAKRRLEYYGPNQLKEAPRPTFWQMLWEQLNNFVVILLIVASLISALLGDYVEAAAIMAIVVLNAILGIVQERRAEEALAALKKLAAPDAQVLRDGHRTTVPAYELVPGDIVFLEAGNFVPADIRLLEAVNLRVEEASLTGESLPVQKNAATVLDKNVPLGDRKNTAFMGTVVTYGRGRGVVTSTGMHTQLGLIAAMLQNVETEETPLQRRLDQLGKMLSVAALLLVAIVFVVALINYTDINALFVDPLNYLKEYASKITDVFIIAVSLAIAAVPEGLPAVVTISLALGMREMIKRHALIRRLASVETLGSATVICSDKTGTLTQNEMTVTRLWADGQFVEVTGSGYVPKGDFLVDGKTVDIQKYPAILTTLWLGVLNNDSSIEITGEKDSQQTYRIVGDPTEGALLVAAAKAGAMYVEVKQAYPRESEVPFDSERKRMITVHDVSQPDPNDFSPFYEEKYRGWDVIAMKGAPDIVLDLCTQYLDINDKPQPLDDAMRQRILQANEQMTRDALRVLGVAYRAVKDVPDNLETLKTEELEKDLIFVGLIGMIDPARAEVRPALEKAREAGIRTIMITGDYPNTARAIAETIGMLKHGRGVLTGAQLDALSDDDLRKVINETSVFARVSPEHKMRIVDALQANGEVVAMTGDGVNDAPAIKRADIGIAMGITGTDVAKETADMVLTDDNYASIVAAVEQGRIIYSNIRKFVFFLLSSNIAEIMIIFLTTLAGLPPPLTAIQLLWLNLITDGAPALALAVEKGDPDIMQQKPRAKDEPIINRSMSIGLVVQTIAQTGAVLTAFGLGLLWHLEAGANLVGNPIAYILNHNWQGVDVQTAETMAFVTLSLAELFRAYTVRSERASLFSIGIFSNRYMQYAVGLSISLLLLVCAVPFLQPIFNTHFLSLREWGVVLSLAIFPAVAEEITKFFLRMKKE
ncbi:MAG: cation-translocating P-type ATPase [Chloroflexota bacterium]|nr:cation-translocating P-type ATPase [Chloroflexota bacterium]MBI5703194.1 cation-translocating P-type ATPase [Chloroflexota bacterium]